MSESKLCAMVATAIVSAGLLFASSAWCASATLSRSLIAQGCLADASNGNQIFVTAQLDALNPINDIVSVAMISAATGSPCLPPSFSVLWSCAALGSSVPALLNLKINSNLTTANFNLDLTQPAFTCIGGTPAATVQVACSDTGYFNRSVENGTLRYPNQPRSTASVHAVSIAYDASCAGSADSENFSTSLGGTVAYQQSVQTGK